MNKLRRIVGNTVISLFGQATTWTSTLLLTMAYGRFLGDIKFGELYFAISFVALVGFPLEFGFNQQLTRDAAQKPDRALSYLVNILYLKLALWLVLYSIILIICWLSGYSAEIRLLIALCGIALLGDSVANAFAALHYALERVVFPVIGAVLEKGLAALAGIILLYNGASVQTMALILLVAALVNAVWQGLWAFRLVGISFTINFPLARDILKTSTPFIIYGVLGVIYYRIDTVLLSLMTSAAVVGWYGAGYRIFDTLVFLPSLVISAIMYPIFSKLSLHAERDLQIAVEKSMNFLLFSGVPIAIGIAVTAPALVDFLYHRSEFLPAIPVMQWLAPGLLCLYINSVLASTMVSVKREKKITLMAAIALVFNLGLNLLLIPRYQQVGAAAVTSLTELLLMCLSFAFTPHTLLPRGSIKVGLKALGAGLVMGLVAWFLRQCGFLLILPVAALVYCAMATLLGTIPRSDMQMLYHSIRAKGQAKSERQAEADKPVTSAEEVGAEASLSASAAGLPNYLNVGFPNYLPELDEDTLPRIPVRSKANKSRNDSLLELDEDTLPRIPVRSKANKSKNDSPLALDEDTLPRIPVGSKAGGGENGGLPELDEDTLPRIPARSKTTITPPRLSNFSQADEHASGSL